MKKKMTILLLIVVLVFTCMTACSSPNNNVNSTNPTISTDIKPEGIVWPTSNAGGYEIDTDVMYCKMLVNGEYRYSCFESYDNGHKIELYVGPTEMIVIDSIDGRIEYYHETYEDIDQTYTNPLLHMWEDLDDLDFVNNGDVEIDGKSYTEYVATQVICEEYEGQINYNVYTVEMEWIDGKTYTFKYYDYSDGSILISAEAPNEINPMINENTTWVVDMDIPCVYNSADNTRIPLTVVNISTGQAMSPEGGNTVVDEYEHQTYLYINNETGEIDEIRYVVDGSESSIAIFHDMEIERPELDDAWAIMDSETVQSALMLIYMLESLI